MKHDQYWQKPKKAGAGWWYASRGSIEVHCDATEDKRHTAVRITRSQLAEYLRRSSTTASSKEK